MHVSCPSHGTFEVSALIRPTVLVQYSSLYISAVGPFTQEIYGLKYGSSRYMPSIGYVRTSTQYLACPTLGLFSLSPYLEQRDA